MLILSLAYGETATPYQASLDVQNQLLADTQWVQLQKELPAAQVAKSTKIDPSSYINQAAKYRDFYSKYPGYSQAAAARCNEAIALIAASRYGDVSNPERCSAAVAAVLNDTAIPEAQRYQVAASAQEQEFGSKRLRGAAKTEALESLYKKLIAQFPSQALSYERLLGVAEESAPEQGLRLASELQKMDKASAKVRAKANILETRFSLVGKSFQKISHPIVGSFAGLDTFKGHPIVIYSWSLADSQSVKLGKSLAATAELGTLLIAINTDFDQTAARQFAEQERLPGVLYCDGKGGFGEFAKALEMRTPGQAYLVTSDGIVSSVQLQRDRSVQALLIGRN